MISKSIESKGFHSLEGKFIISWEGSDLQWRQTKHVHLNSQLIGWFYI